MISRRMESQIRLLRQEKNKNRRLNLQLRKLEEERRVHSKDARLKRENGDLRKTLEKMKRDVQITRDHWREDVEGLRKLLKERNDQLNRALRYSVRF